MNKYYEWEKWMREKITIWNSYIMTNTQWLSGLQGTECVCLNKTTMNLCILRTMTLLCFGNNTFSF